MSITQGYWYLNEAGTMVCSKVNGKTKYIARVRRKDEPDTAEDRANGHLLAASKLLFECACASLALLAALRPVLVASNDEFGEKLDMMSETMRGIIRKAEGRSDD